MKVYLAGPITGLDFDSAQDWRNVVGRRLEIMGVKALSPLRNQEYLRAAGTLTAEAKECIRFNDPLTLPMGLTNRDRFDATRCDVLFVNFLGATRPSLGTAMEIAWADLKRTPIVIVQEPEGNPNAHAMIAASATAIVPTLEEGIRCTLAILGA